MTAIDCTDCYLAIEIGDGVKRALVNHFGRFIGERLAMRGIAVDGGAARDGIDRDAWRLARCVLGEVESELAGAFDENLLGADPQQGAQEMLAIAINASVVAAERRYLADDLLGAAALVAKIAPNLS